MNIIYNNIIHYSCIELNFMMTKKLLEGGISYSFNEFPFVSMGSNSTTKARSKQVSAYG